MTDPNINAELKISADSKISATSTLKDILASIVGSAACVYTGQPFDTIKVRIQVQPGFFQSPLEAMKKTVTDEGIFALWRGSVPAFIGALGENAMAFGVNGFLKRFLNERGNSMDTKQDKSLIEPFITGGITGAFTPLVLCPCDVLKCRAQMNRASGQDSSLRHVIRSTIQRQGLRGLFAGFPIQFTRDVIFYSSFFGTYDVACIYLKKHTSLSDPIVYFTAGGLAGQVAWALSIASDTIKSRIQTSPLVKPPSIKTIFNEILSTQGYRGFFRGIEVAIVRAFPANAALFVGYELTRQGLDKVIPS